MGAFSKERLAGVVIETLDGRAYVGADLRGAVNSMRADAWGCPDARNLAGYMEAVARRTHIWCKAFIRTDSVELFCGDLENAGVITIRAVQ